MRRDDFIIFGDVDTRNYSVGIYGDQLASAPERDITKVVIPGHNGELTMDNGRYNNVTVSYKAYIVDNYDANIRGLRNALFSKSGYQRLEDTIHPDEYRLARAMPFEVDEVGVLRAGEFTMQFDCYPQRFLKEGEMPYPFFRGVTPETIMNPGMKTFPLLKMAKNVEISINGIDIVCNCESNEIVTVDCELQEAYIGTLDNPANDKITLVDGVFPWFDPGENEIFVDNDLSHKSEIIPRWWIL